MAGRVSHYRDSGVLVTGGAGVIGRELIQSLLAGGARVMCADLKPPPDGMDPGVTYVEGDANELTADIVRDFDPAYCFHLAATFERTEETEGFWDENFRHNVQLSHHVATVTRSAPSLRRNVFASSYLVYDPALYLFDSPQSTATRLSESDRLRPRNLCGSAKLMHEQELEFLGLFDRAGLSSISARIFRVYGRGSKDVVSRWVRSLITDPDAPLAAFATDGMFDYVYAGDVAEGLLRLGATKATGVVNLASGKARRVSELLELLAERFPGAKWSSDASDIPLEAHQADLGRLEGLTGWRPRTGLEEGLDILIEHERTMGAPVTRSERQAAPRGGQRGGGP